MTVKQPNILLIMVDQQRYDCLGHSRDYPVQTPHLDKLAEQGMWFTHAFTPIPLCSPARQAFMAGRRAESLGTLWNYNLGPHIPDLSPDIYVWTRDLLNNGYRNGHIGKWHVSEHHDPRAFGYETYIGEDQYNHFRKSLYPEQPLLHTFPSYVDTVPVEHSRTHWLAEQAIQVMKSYQQQGGPWHVRLDLTDPHPPYVPNRVFADLYEPEHIPKWRSFHDSFEGKPYIQRQQLVTWEIDHYKWEDWAPIVAHYYAHITQTDDAIGKLLAALEESGEAENTLVIYTTDHGDMCGSHGMFDKHCVMYDDIVRVPMIIRWPGVVQAGSNCDAMVCNLLDLVPTLLEAAGLPLPEVNLHGRSLMPLLQGITPEDWPEQVVSTYNGQQFGLYIQRMLRTKDWKYIWNPTDVDELYDLQKDPEELHNVIDNVNLTTMVSEFRARLYQLLLNDEDRTVNNMWVRNQLIKGRKLPLPRISE